MAKCLSCGSAMIIPGVPLLDHYGDVGAFSKSAEVQVHGEPSAWFFKDTVAGKLVADICGECGRVELRVENCRDLYDKYLKSRGQ